MSLSNVSCVFVASFVRLVLPVALGLSFLGFILFQLLNFVVYLKSEAMVSLAFFFLKIDLVICDLCGFL